MKKPNYTQIPHEVIDIHLANLTESELKILLVILRRTTGWHKDCDTASYADLSRLTGLERGSCCKAAHSLEEKGLIVITRHSNEEGKCASTYEPNFDDLTGGGVSTEQQGCFPGETGGVSVRKQYKEKENKNKEKEKTPIVPFTSAEEMLLRWRQHSKLKKPAKHVRERVAAIWDGSGIQITADQLGSALDGFVASTWARQNAYPIFGFIKDPLSWIKSAEEPTENEAGRIADAPEVPNRQEAPLGAPESAGTAIVDEQFERYMQIFIVMGKAIGEDEREKALPRWSKLTADQREATITDAAWQAQYVWKGAELIYRPGPEGHLKRKPWTRVHTDKPPLPQKKAKDMTTEDVIVAMDAYEVQKLRDAELKARCDAATEEYNRQHGIA